MKCSLVFALFGVFLVLKNIEAEECVPIPSFFINISRHCFASLNEADRELYVKREEPDKREFKCFHLCLSDQLGIFEDGKFNVERMKEINRKYIPTKELAEAVIARDEDSMLKAQETEGDYCDIAHEYFKINLEKEMKEPLVSNIFCLNKVRDEGMKN